MADEIPTPPTPLAGRPVLTRRAALAAALAAPLALPGPAEAASEGLWAAWQAAVVEAERLWTVDDLTAYEAALEALDRAEAALLDAPIRTMTDVARRIEVALHHMGGDRAEDLDAMILKDVAARCLTGDAEGRAGRRVMGFYEEDRT